MLLSKIDAFIVVAYMAVMLLMGYLVGKDNKNQEDYFLAGRSMSWFPVGLSVAATMISCNAFIGGPGWGYENGLLPFMQNIAVPLSIFISITIFTPMLYKLKLTSIYEYIELRLGNKTRMISVLAFMANSLIQVSSMVFIPSLVLNRFTGISIHVIIPIIVVTAILYTLIGGIKAVIWTDALQMLVIWGGVIGGIIYTFSNSGIGFFETLSTAGEIGKLSAIDFSINTSLFNENGAWVALLGGSVMWLRYFAFDQSQVQRMNTAKSIKDLKKSLVISGILMNTLFFIFVILGSLLFVQFGGMEFANSNDVMVEFIGNLPVGLIGLLLAGLFAASMSSVDSILNSMSTVFVKDIYERYITKGKEASLKTSMLISLLWGVLICLVTVVAFSGTTKSILAVIGNYISYISGPSCGVFLLAMLTKKANDKGTAIGSVLGFVFVLIFGQVAGLTWMWNSAVGTIATIVFGYIASCLIKEKLPKNAEEYTLLGYRKKMITEGNTYEDGISLLPFKIDKYGVILLGFFLLQFIILLILSK
ncbi:MAG: sodium/solute symporter [Terrisporobacter sp.]